MWWIALVAAVGAAVLAACVGCGVFLLWRRRYGHGRREGAHPATDQVSMYLACEETLLEHAGGSLYIQRGAACRMLSAGMPVGCHVCRNMLMQESYYRLVIALRSGDSDVICCAGIAKTGWSAPRGDCGGVGEHR